MDGERGNKVFFGGEMVVLDWVGQREGGRRVEKHERDVLSRGWKTEKSERPRERKSEVRRREKDAHKDQQVRKGEEEGARQ